MATRHIPSLDGLRGVAILLVITFHCWQVGLGTGKLGLIGQTGVDLFFVLSGFLITGILIDARGSKGMLGTFYARRFLRIFPLYYGTLIAIFLLLPLLHLRHSTDLQTQAWFWGYLENFPFSFGILLDGPNHFWSLAVEEQFYLFWPLVVLRSTNRSLIGIAGAGVVCSVLCRIAMKSYDPFYFTFARLDSLAVGSAIAVLTHMGPGLKQYVPISRILFPVSIGLLAAFSFWRSLFPLVKLTLASFVYGFALVLIVERSLGAATEKLLTFPLLRSIGKYSYAMYIFHPFLIAAMYGYSHMKFGVIPLVLSVSSAYVAGWLSWTFFESPILSLKSRFQYSSPPRGAVSAATSRA